MASDIEHAIEHLESEGNFDGAEAVRKLLAYAGEQPLIDDLPSSRFDEAQAAALPILAAHVEWWLHEAVGPMPHPLDVLEQAVRAASRDSQAREETT